MFSILVDRREDFIRKMTEKGIEVSAVQARNDKNPYAEKFQKELPIMDLLDSHIISVPNGWWLTKEDREYIVETIKGGW
jgi:dTDP-4-amino-4,6-dideoxygalactose transaminase